MEYKEAYEVWQKCKKYDNVNGRRMIPVIVPLSKDDRDIFLSQVTSKTISNAVVLNYCASPKFTVVYIYQKGDIMDYVLIDDSI